MMTPAIPDFLDLPYAPHDEAALCRTDLADLRLHVRHPEGIESGRCISKSARKRLLAHSMLSWNSETGRVVATAFGIEVARANASCIDGSESLDRPSAYYRDRTEGVLDEDEIIGSILDYEQRLAADRGITTAVMVARAMSDTLPPPPAVLSTAAPARPVGRLGKLLGVMVGLIWLLVDDIANARKV